jgi:hypothetical protein
MFSSAGTWKLVNIEGMDGAKCREILEGNMFQCSRDLRLGLRLTFSRTTTLSILLKQPSSGLRGNIEMSWNGLVKDQTSIKLCPFSGIHCTQSQGIYTTVWAAWLVAN